MIDKNTDPRGYCLLRCIRSYVNLDCYAALAVQTEETIALGRAEVDRFSALIQEYISTFEEDEAPDFNFPKAHMHSHLYDDIVAKGITLNYTTMINERIHRYIKEYYHERTNFRDVAEQLSYFICFNFYYSI